MPAGPMSLALLSCGLFWLGLIMFGRHNPVLRAVAAGWGIVVTGLYVVWRVTDGMPADQGAIANLGVMIYVGFEMANLLGSSINFLMLSRTRRRSEEADIHANHPACRAPVDVFIATYNEGFDILERTLLGACAIDHPDLRVWLLDDGARDWVRQLAAQQGAQYLSRIKGPHAKAGNVNNGLRAALCTGRRPEFVLLLDADFVASRHILKRTLPLFHAVDVGIVQTPQHFFNPDPIQTNVMSPTVWPDEQRYFFHVLMPSLDAWDGAFCCGTSAVMRVAALEAIGGLATETVTEDMLTSFKLSEQGWRTVYLNEPLSLGLAAEGISAFVVQRSRWCLGAVQQIYTRWSFFGIGRLRAIDRLNNFASVLYWTTSFWFRLMVLAMPAAWWWTGVTVYRVEGDALMRSMLPWLAFNIMFMSVYGRNFVMPLLSDVSQLVPSMAVIGSAMTGLVSPWGHPFKVTDKGLNSTGVTVHWRRLAPFLLLALVTIAGMFSGLGAGSMVIGQPGTMLIVFWSLVSTILLAITCVACIDQPMRRTDERFISGERAVLLAAGGRHEVCRISDISLGGALVEVGSDPALWAAGGVLWLDDGKIQVAFAPLRAGPGRMAVRFVLDEPTRAAMIIKLFDLRYKVEFDWVSPLPALRSALVRLLE